MALPTADRLAIHELLALHGHLMDDGQFDRLGELFTSDVVYDLTELGGGTLRGPTAVRAAALALGEGNPLGHHVTNVIVTEASNDMARVSSKWLGVRTDGSVGSGVYEDEVTRSGTGWRISYRKVIVRRTPLKR